MAAATASAPHRFELIDNMLRLVFQVAEIFMIFWVFSEFANQLFVAYFVDHRVADGFDFEVTPDLCNKIKACQKGFPAF